MNGPAALWFSSSGLARHCTAAYQGETYLHTKHIKPNHLTSAFPGIFRGLGGSLVLEVIQSHAIYMGL